MFETRDVTFISCLACVVTWFVWWRKREGGEREDHHVMIWIFLGVKRMGVMSCGLVREICWVRYWRDELRDDWSVGEQQWPTAMSEVSLCKWHCANCCTVLAKSPCDDTQICSAHVFRSPYPELFDSIYIKVKESRDRPGVAQRVPGGLGFQIFMTFGKRRWWGRQPHAPANFTARNVPGTHFH